MCDQRLERIEKARKSHERDSGLRFYPHLKRSRDGGIRTHDPLHPMQVRYRTAPRPDLLMWTK